MYERKGILSIFHVETVFYLQRKLFSGDETEEKKKKKDTVLANKASQAFIGLLFFFEFRWNKFIST